MKQIQHALIGMASDDIGYSLNILRKRALNGTKARPTVSELNEIMKRLDLAKKALNEAMAHKSAA